MNVIIFLLLFTTLAQAQDYTVDADSNFKRLMLLDKNKDKKLTLDDGLIKDQTFSLTLANKKSVKVQGLYFLSNLLQELKLATENETKEDILSHKYIFENPVDRISRLIREIYWDGLTRKIDKAHLSQVLPDSKIKSQTLYLYVPEKDNKAMSYFQDAARTLPQMKVKSVPSVIDKKFLKSLKGEHGLLALEIGTPYVVPGGRFNEMYGWDSYFEALGLIQDKRLDLARGMVDNQVYEIHHYGKILNANRTYYLGRSQPPFLSSMVRAVYEAMPRKERSSEWLAKSLKAVIREYDEVWMGKDRLTSMGLSRYYGTSPEVPPEVEPGHYDDIYASFAKEAKLSVREYERRYKAGKIKEPELDEFFIHDQAVRESGHDTTYRWRKDGKDKCADFVTVDLNALLYKMELDIAYLIRNEFKDNFEGKKSATFFEKARQRKKLIRDYLWDKKGMFYDYDHKAKKRSDYISATAVYPLWAYEATDKSTRILNDEEAKLLIENLLKELETAGGLTATSLASLKRVGGVLNERQWDYPNGWAPHQMLAWEGLRNYGYGQLADRLAYKWLYMITKNAMDFNGTIPEKYDVVNTTHKVFAEYGNVGTKFSYITREGFGWMNASYQVGLQSLPLTLQHKLKKMVPPSGL